MDDDLYERDEYDDEDGNAATELVYDEWFEVMGRICHQKLGPEPWPKPFHQMFDTWLKDSFWPTAGSRKGPGKVSEGPGSVPACTTYGVTGRKPR